MPTLTIRKPADVAAYVPMLLGFTPTDSVVLLNIGSFHARIDMPATGPQAVDLAHQLAKPMQQHGVETFLLAYYGDPERALVTHTMLTTTLLDYYGLEPVEAVYVHPKGGMSLITYDVFETETPVEVADAVLAGTPITRSRADIVAEAESVTDAAAALERAWTVYRKGDGASAWIYLDRYDVLREDERSQQADLLEHRLLNAIDPREA